jgi:hypothetical protein
VVVGEAGEIKLVEVKAKNHGAGYPTPLWIVVDGDRRHSVGWFMSEYMRLFGIVPGDAPLFFGYMVMCKLEVFSAFPKIAGLEEPFSTTGSPPSRSWVWIQRGTLCIAPSRGGRSQ